MKNLNKKNTTFTTSDNRGAYRTTPPYEHRFMIGKIELYAAYSAPAKEVLDSLYDGTTRLRNWAPGVLKNQLQQLMFYFNKGVAKELNEEVADKEKLKALKKGTLYVPDYVLIKFNKFNGDESKRLEEKDIFKDYKYPYKLVSSKELNDKILNDKEPFYYLNYVKSSTQKYMAIVDSQTGQLIYMRHTGTQYNIKDSDFEALMDAINGK